MPSGTNLWCCHSYLLFGPVINPKQKVQLVAGLPAATHASGWCQSSCPTIRHPTTFSGSTAAARRGDGRRGGRRGGLRGLSSVTSQGQAVAMSYATRSLSSQQMRATSSASSSSHSPALVSRIEEKKAELQNLKELRDLSAAVANQMEALEQKFTTLSDGTEGKSLDHKCFLID